MKRYPKYKDSGVEWIGELPENWSLLVLKRVISRFIDYRGKTPEKTENGIPLITAKNIKNGSFNFNTSQEFISDDTYNNWMVRGFPEKDDVLVTTEAPLGETAQIINEKIALAQRIILLKSKKELLNDSYLKCFFLSQFGQSELYSRGTGSTALGIKASKLKRILISVPPLMEQQSIAIFLDHKTHKIDTLIEKKQKQIDLLKEQRTAIINQAVTKGLNSNVKMKDSGIEWLGEIPAHWEKLQLKRLLISWDYGISENIKGEGPIKVLTMGHIQEGEIILPTDGCLSEVLKELLLEENDLLYNRTNSKDLVAKVGLFHGNNNNEVSFASYLVRLKMNKRTVPKYMNYHLNSWTFISNARSNALHSINQSNLNATKYTQFFLCIPPKKEQYEILKYLDKKTLMIKSSISIYQNQIKYLKEYRTTLISDVVTGKIDIRDEGIP